MIVRGAVNTFTLGFAMLTRKGWLVRVLTDGTGETVDRRSVSSHYVELIMGLVTTVPD